MGNDNLKEQAKAILRKRRVEAAKRELARRAEQVDTTQRENYEGAILKNGQYQVGNPQGYEQQPLQRLDNAIQSVAGVVEPVMTMASSVAAEPIAGASALLAAPFVGSEAAGQMVGTTKESLTYQPRTEKGRSNMEAAKKAAGRGVQYMSEQFPQTVQAAKGAVDSYGAFADAGADVGGPLLGTAIKVLPTALAEYLTLGVASKVRKGQKLLDTDGLPTSQLEKLLNKDGLTYDQLTPEAKGVIGEYTGTGLIPSPKRELAVVGDKAMVAQLKSGGRDNALAPYRLAGSKVVPDKVAIEAIDQGWRDGTVQMAKTANLNTKKTMNKMLNMRWALLKNDSQASKLFPLNAVGDSFNERIKFINGKAKTARIELNQIARTKLPGMDIDPTPIVDHLKGALDKLDITTTFNQNGVPQLDFIGSVIQKDPTAQRVIQDAIDLMATGGKADGYKFHVFKKQLDSLIDHKKKSKDGLTESGRSLLKGLRVEVNNSLRAASSDYARVNDVLSKSIQGIEDFQKATGVKLDLLQSPGGAIGQEMRKLHTNYKKRAEIAQATKKIDDLANEFGGNFNENYEDLAMFANRMDEVFGASKSGNFQGISEAAINATTTGKASMVVDAVDYAKDVHDKLKGRNQFGQYQSMKELLKRL